MSDVTTELANEANDKTMQIARLKAENAKLREQIDAAHMSRLLTENENEELRELSARAWRLFTEHGAVHESDIPEVDAVRDKMRELGVEVDA